MSYITGLERPAFSSGQWHAEHSYERINRSKDKEQDRNQQRSQGNSYSSSSFSTNLTSLGHGYDMNCKWEPLRGMILAQWNKLTSWELDAVGPNRSKLATLIQSKYGVETRLIENYLRNFERVLPVV